MEAGRAITKQDQKYFPNHNGRVPLKVALAVFSLHFLIKDVFRLVEVNRVNIGGENHKQVVARIKSREDETILLVADEGCDLYHKERAIIITNSLPSLIKLSNAQEDLDYKDEEEDSDEEEVLDTRLQTVTFRESPEESEKVSESRKEKESVRRQDSGDSGVSGEGREVESPHSPHEALGLAGLGLTVQQMKEKLRRRRRHDPRLDPRKRQSGDWWTQYKMIQTL